MGDLNSVYPLLGIVILIVLLCRFDGRFTKIEKELDAIKKTDGCSPERAGENGCW